MKFIGRKDHLKKLEKLAKTSGAKLVVVKGRRRIGKSRLINECAKQKTFYEFTGLPPLQKTSAQAERDEFGRQLGQHFNLPSFNASDWGDLFSALFELMPKNEEVVVLLDEISWMGSLDPLFLGKLKIAWDTQFKKHQKLTMVFCGSISSWIEKNILSSTGFFGRINLTLTLEELSLDESNGILKARGCKTSALEKYYYLCVTGGVPWYLEQYNSELSITNNIKERCFEKDGLFVTEFTKIFNDLFGRRSETYTKIITMLAQGPKEHLAISEGIEFSSGGILSEYLEDLTLSGFIVRDNSWSTKTGLEGKLLKYRLKDNYLRFYCKYIQPNLSKIERGHFKNVQLTSLHCWNAIMGLQFENIILHNRHLIYDALDIAPEDIVIDNPYYQNKNTKQHGVQIDLMIQTRFNTLYACEIKFTKDPVLNSVKKSTLQKLGCITKPKGFSVVPVLIQLHDDDSPEFKHINASRWLKA